MNSAGKILAIKTRALGDTVLLSASLSELRRLYPNAEIQVLVSEAWLPILQGQPAVSKFWALPAKKDRIKRAVKILELVFRLRREHFDLVINFHASPTSAWIARLSGAPVRSIHFHGHGDANRFSTVHVPGKGILKPAIERDLDAIRALGKEVSGQILPSVSVPSEAILKMRDWLQSQGLTGPVLVLGIGASRPTKGWPIENFAALAREWCGQTSGSVLALAAPEEEPLLDCLEESIKFEPAPGKVVTCSALSQIELAAALKCAAIFVGNDSGPKHVAAAVGTPTITLFGPEHPFEWHPYPTDLHPYFFVEGLTCRRDGQSGMPPWCGLQVCVAENLRCMREIQVKPVLQECLRCLKR